MLLSDIRLMPDKQLRHSRAVLPHCCSIFYGLDFYGITSNEELILAAKQLCVVPSLSQIIAFIFYNVQLYTEVNEI